MNKTIIIFISVVLLLIVPANAIDDQSGFFIPVRENTEKHESVSLPVFSTGMIVPEHLRNSKYVASKSEAGDLPSKWDWRNRSGVTPVKNQLLCGSCYAFGSIGMIESYIKVDSGKTYDLSEEQAKNCMWESINTNMGGCSGGTIQWTINTFTQHGIVLEEDDPYYPVNGFCTIALPTLRVTDWNMLSTGAVPSRDTLKKYVMNSPVVTSLIVSGWDEYNGTYVLSPYKEGKPHAVVIVGWNDSVSDENVSGHWIIKNSWGKNWGDNGYAYIEYDTARIGTWVSVIDGYEKYDPYISTLNYDEAGWNEGLGHVGSDRIRGLAKFNVTNEEIKAIEFWTTGKTSDVDLYLYDGFDGVELGNILYSHEDLSYDEPGYHSEQINEKIISTTGNIVVVASIENIDCVYSGDTVIPIAIDIEGPAKKGETYVSVGDPDSELFNVWLDTGDIKLIDESVLSANVALRLRVAESKADVESIGISTVDKTENISNGATINFTATCFDADGNEVFCGLMTWMNENESVGTLDSFMNTANFTANRTGNTSVHVSGNKTSNSIPISVVPSCDYIILETENDITELKVGTDLKLITTCFNTDGNEMECYFEYFILSDETVGRMNGMIFEAKTPGETTVTAKGSCDNKYSNTVTITVTASKEYLTEEEFLARMDDINKQIIEMENQTASDQKNISALLDNIDIDTNIIIPGDMISLDTFNEVIDDLQTRLDDMKVKNRTWYQKVIDYINKLIG